MLIFDPSDARLTGLYRPGVKKQAKTIKANNNNQLSPHSSCYQVEEPWLPDRVVIRNTKQNINPQNNNMNVEAYQLSYHSD